MSLKDKVKIWAWICAFLLIFAAIFHLDATHQQKTRLDALLKRWRVNYHLNEEQLRRIRGMEEEFHGSGDPFFEPRHTRVETREHHRQMADVMNPDDGERFFRAQEGEDLPHPH